MQVHIPVIEAHGLTIAVLFCFRNGKQLGLLLHPCEYSVDPTRPLYHTSYAFDVKPDNPGNFPPGFMDTYRLIPIGGTFHDLRLGDQPVTAEWRDIYLELKPTQIMRHVTINRSLDSPFRVPHWLISKLRTTWGFEIYTTGPRLKPETSLKRALIDFRHVTGEAFGVWDAAADSEQSTESAQGSHNVSTSGSSFVSRRHATPWAFAFMLRYGVPSPGPEHRCSEDHILRWPGGTRTFGDDRRSVRLAFRPCPIRPDSSLVLDIDLEGWVFTKVKELQTTWRPLPPGWRFLHSEHAESSSGDGVSASLKTSTASGSGTSSAHLRAMSGDIGDENREGEPIASANVENLSPHRPGNSELVAAAQSSTKSGLHSPSAPRHSKSLATLRVSDVRLSMDVTALKPERRHTVHAAVSPCTSQLSRIVLPARHSRPGII
ncbi:hypothetical protein BV20DRAFT_423784 [Pilatotrama ljubarskyi]|nr:hypothetical protein BV20DRAFT_423784 [Pilatotrama ljubarskyi]